VQKRIKQDKDTAAVSPFAGCW